MRKPSKRSPAAAWLKYWQGVWAPAVRTAAGAGAAAKTPKTAKSGKAAKATKAARPAVARSVPTSAANVMKGVMKRAVQGAARRATRQVGQTLSGGTLHRSAPPPGPGEWLSGMVMGAGGMRNWHLYRPPVPRFGARLPVLVMLHGCGQDAPGFARATRMNRIAGREACMVLYPEQSRLANGQRCWNWFDTESGQAQAEVALILRAIDQVCLLHGGDRSRVAVAGLSAGASMAALLASRHPDRFSAVAMCAGVAPGLAHSATTALRVMQGRFAMYPGGAPADLRPQAWPPLLVIHGQTDRVVLPKNGRHAAVQWARMTGATVTEPRRVQRGQRHPATVVDFRREGRTQVTLMEVDQLGHAWSGGPASQAYSDPKGPDATALIWRFVAAAWGRAESTP